MAQVFEYIDNCTVGNPIPIPAEITDLTMPCICVDSGSSNKVDYERYTICDVVQASISGDIDYNLLGTQVSFTPNLTVTGDTVLTYIVDFGNGFMDIGNSPNYDYVTEASGRYEIRFYAKLASGNVVLLSAREVTWDGTTLTGVPVNVVVSRGYGVKVATALANWEDGSYVGITDLVGNPYTLVGDASSDCPPILDEIINSDEKMGGASVILRSGTLSIANGTHSTLLGPDGTAWTNPGNLKSVTILARKSNASDAIVGSGANQVMVITTDNKYILLEGESVTYSVEDGNIQDFVSVECLVNSAALVVYNRS